MNILYNFLNINIKYEHFMKVPGGITSIMPSIQADLINYINCIENLRVYKGESTLPTREINLKSLYADNLNIMPTDLIVSDLLFIRLFIIFY